MSDLCLNFFVTTNTKLFKNNYNKKQVIEVVLIYVFCLLWVSFYFNFLCFVDFEDLSLSRSLATSPYSSVLISMFSLFIVFCNFIWLIFLSSTRIASFGFYRAEIIIVFRVSRFFNYFEDSVNQIRALIIKNVMLFFISWHCYLLLLFFFIFIPDRKIK